MSSGRNPYVIATVKLLEEDLLRAAKEADARALADEAIHAANTKRPTSTYPEIVVSFEPDAPNAELDHLLRGLDDGVPAADGVNSGTPTPLRPAPLPDTPEAPESPAAGAIPSDHTDIRPTWRNDEGPAPTSVPCVMVSRDDLSWFGIDPAAEGVLAVIDGATTVEDIVDAVAIPREHTLLILRELASHGVVEFH